MLTLLPLLWLVFVCTLSCEGGYGLDSDGSCKPSGVPGQNGDSDTPAPADTGDPRDSGPGGVLSLEWGTRAWTWAATRPRAPAAGNSSTWSRSTTNTPWVPDKGLRAHRPG
jgi:hypothetical protein